MTSALHSSENPRWQTPGWFLDLVREVAPIALDPCTAPENPTGAAEFFAPRVLDIAGWSEDGARRWRGPCGLEGSWSRRGGLAFVNPPYGAHLAGPVDPRKKIWRTVKKVRTLAGVGTGWAARIARDLEPWIVLVPNRTEVAWFEALHAASTWRAEMRRRIAFVHPETGLPGKQPNHGSVVFTNATGAMSARFFNVFGRVARILPGGRM